MDAHIHAAELVIRISIGTVMILFGLSQMLRPKPWLVYIPKPLEFILPVKPETTMRVHSLGNLVLGVLFLIGAWPVVMAWIIGAWWLSIFPFAMLHDRFIALRDGITICAIVAMIILLHS